MQSLIGCPCSRGLSGLYKEDIKSGERVVVGEIGKLKRVEWSGFDQNILYVRMKFSNNKFYFKN